MNRRKTRGGGDRGDAALRVMLASVAPSPCPSHPSAFILHPFLVLSHLDGNLEALTPAHHDGFDRAVRQRFVNS